MRLVTQVFMAHTKLDEKFCAKFDQLAVREGLKVLRSEFEQIDSPACKVFRTRMISSNA